LRTRSRPDEKKNHRESPKVEKTSDVLLKNGGKGTTQSGDLKEKITRHLIKKKNERGGKDRDPTAKGD